MPGTWTEPATDATTLGTVVQRGGSRYARVPADWPTGARVRVLLLPAEGAPTGRSSPEAPSQ